MPSPRSMLGALKKGVILKYGRSLCAVKCHVFADFTGTLVFYPFKNLIPNVQHTERTILKGARERSDTRTHSTDLPLHFYFNSLLFVKQISHLFQWKVWDRL